VSEPDLLAIQRGLVVAPAGCGKTQSIVAALQRHCGPKPVLVLTHTNAGVAALRQRLKQLNVSSKSYRLATLDGWAMQLVATFPTRSGCPEGPAVREPDYVQIREDAARLLESGHIAKILAASYERVLVDEYQDCSIRQHRIVAFAADSLPTVALGDPLQAIFSFDRKDRLPSWEVDVCGFFPPAGTLNEPWRWRVAGNEVLGRWLGTVRDALLQSRAVDLSSAPACVRWVRLRGDRYDQPKRVEAVRVPGRKQDETTLVIGDSASRRGRHRFARSVPGLVTVEPVNLRAVTDFVARLEKDDDEPLETTLAFAGELMTNVERPAVLRRVKVLRSGTAKKPPNEVERAALCLCDAPTPAAVADLLEACYRRSGSRIYRPEILWAAVRALRMSRPGPKGPSLLEAAIRVREERRVVGRRLSTLAIGSTLLLKGLEADHVVLLEAGKLDANNLYVALTRGARSLTVCSRTAKVTPPEST